MDARESFFRDFFDQLQREPGMDAAALQRLKNRLASQYALASVPKNPQVVEWIEAREGRVDSGLRKALKIKHVRALSGISNIALMTAPLPCPGKCIYCPGGPDANSPKAYTGKEPAARRAAQNDYDAFRQVKARLHQFSLLGHVTEKCELIVQGGTFNSLPADYQESFVKGIYDALNGQYAGSIPEAQKLNETAEHRMVGLTFETRPDYCSPSQVSGLLEFGCTRVEIGVQSLSEEVMRKSGRGHTVQDVVAATERMKDSFLKVCYHMMPGLFANPAQDVADMRALFSDGSFQPDMLKIYPTLVMPNTPLYEMWKRGDYVPYNSEQAAAVIAEGKQFVPEHCRIMRVNRDIPSNLIADGVTKSNLRELVLGALKEKGISCRCIRCREAGLKMLKQSAPVSYEDARLVRRDYEASGGREVFLSYEDEAQNALLGFLRLRLPHAPFRKEITENTAGIRELHVYGEQLSLGKRAGSSPQKEVQHEGLGTRLLLEAERIAREEWGARKLLVISGVGVRAYYRKRGFADDGVYLGKGLS